MPDKILALLFFNGEKRGRVIEREGKNWFQPWRGNRWGNSLIESKTMQEYNEVGFVVIPKSLLPMMRKEAWS